MRVLLAQLAPKTADVEANKERVLDVLESYEADVYVFPELFLTGYLAGDEFFTIVDEVMEAVEEIHKAAKGKLVIVGGPEKESEGRLYNSAYILGSLRRTYRKHFLPNHLPFTEKLRFHPGRGEEAFEYLGRKIGVMVCYDAFFPEIARRYAVQGVDLLVTISASPYGRSVYFDTFITARALESGAFHVYVNRVGVDQGLVFRGGSRVIGPEGSVIAMLPRIHETDDVERIEVVRLDKKLLRVARVAAPILRDLRFSPWYDRRKRGVFRKNSLALLEELHELLLPRR